MPERPQNFEEVDDESELTLAAPRFDADEARRAHPVVPLEEIPAGRHAAAGRARFRAGARRWPLSLLAVALLAAFAFGGIFALRRAHTNNPAPPAADAAQDGQPAQTDTAPAQTAAAPAQPAASAQEAQGAPASTEPVEEKTSEEKSAVGEKSEGRAPLRAREPRALHARRDGDALPPPVAERRDVDGEDGDRAEHRGHYKGGDGHDEDRGGGDFKKASKHQKGGARLVDVLVGRPRP
jgi:hypothetical protein